MQRARALAAGRGEAGFALLDGPHLIEDAISAGVRLDTVMFESRLAALARVAAGGGAEIIEASPAVLEAASPVRQPAGIVGIARWQPRPAEDLLGEISGPVVALVDVQDPGNVGGIIRSADALGAAAVLALDETANPSGWKAMRAAMGSTFRIPVGCGPSSPVLSAARRKEIPIVCATVGSGVILYEWSPPRTFVLLVGHEGSGLPQQIVAWSDVRVTIPMRPGLDSLNVGIGTALILSEVARHRWGSAR